MNSAREVPRRGTSFKHKDVRERKLIRGGVNQKEIKHISNLENITVKK